MRRVGVAVCVALGILLIGGCSRDLDVTVRFREVHGLRAGAPVLWNGTPVGRVDEIRYSPDGRFEVGVEVEEAFRDAVTDRSLFVVGTEPDGDDRVLELVVVGEGGAPLRDGAVVDGATRYEAMGEAVRGQIDRFLRDVREIPDSEAFRELEKAVDRLAEQFRDAGREARERLRRDVLPELRRRFDELRRWFEEQGRGRELDPLDRKIRELERT